MARLPVSTQEPIIFEFINSIYLAPVRETLMFESPESLYIVMVESPSQDVFRYYGLEPDSTGKAMMRRRVEDVRLRSSDYSNHRIKAVVLHLKEIVPDGESVLLEVRDCRPMTKPGRSKMLNAIMMEKYLHSRGAILCNEGRFDEAVDTLCAAISIKEQPYTRYQLSQAYLGKEDPEKALEEISHAIALDKGIPEYYYERKKLWLLKGDIEKAQTDYKKRSGLIKIMNVLRENKAKQQEFFIRLFSPAHQNDQ